MSALVAAMDEEIASAVASLRKEFPNTLDLYREVCVLLFFRHGITPTANKLYQLVRKGSMSTPTQALNRFWGTLRERSRVTVDHADLPDELKAAAGEMVVAVWKSAQSVSRAELAEFRAEATAAVNAAAVSAEQAAAAQTAAVAEIDRVRAELHESQALTAKLHQELAAAAASATGLEARLDDGRRQVNELQLQLKRARDEHANERNKLAERTRLAELRFSDMEKRALLEIDRERTSSAKLEKTLQTERASHAAGLERLRVDHNSAQVTVGKLLEQIGSLESSVDTLTKERAREQEELHFTRLQLEVQIRQAAADGARAEWLRLELERHRTDTRTRTSRTAKSPPAPRKRKTPPSSSGTEEK